MKERLRMTEPRFSAFWERRLGRRRLLRGAALAGAATGVVSLAGCARTAPPSASEATASPAAPTSAAPAPSVAAAQPSATPRAKYGGAFRHAGIADTASLDTHQTVTGYLHVWGPGVAYSKLLQFKADPPVKALEIVPVGDLAESWDQPDDTTYVFKLRKDAKFHNIAPVNGRPVVAQDVKLSFERQIALKVNASNLPAGAKFEAVDPQTLKITLERPDADILPSLAQYQNKIIPHESWELKGDLNEGPIIGSGPWIFEKWERNSVANLVKNPDYYVKGLPRVDRLEFPRILDASTRYGAFRAQQVDALPGVAFTPTDGETLKKAGPDIVLDGFQSVSNDNMAMNTTKPPFNDVRVRQAFFKALDRQQLIDTVLSGKGWYYSGVFMPKEDWYLPEAELRNLVKRDVAGAKQLLAQAGVAPGAEFEAVVGVVRDSVLDAAQLVKAQLADIGIVLTIKPVDTATFSRVVIQDRGHFVGFGGGALPYSTNSDLYVSHHSTGSQNRAALKDPKLDQMIEQQATMVKDPDGRKKLLQDIQRYILNSAHLFPLYGLVDQRLRWKYVQDWPEKVFMAEPFVTAWLDK
jgi:peptide/nickel transport system substrate-binding protein